MSSAHKIQQYMHQLGKNARQAAQALLTASTQQKNQALLAMAEHLEQERISLKVANAKDLKAGQEKGLSDAMLDRLTLTDARITSMIKGIHQVIDLADPIGTISDLKFLPSGIQLGRMRVPLGVVGIIYESRPNVTIDAAILTLKSGNATILRGGSEAMHSNQAIAASVRHGLVVAGLPADAVQVVETSDRQAVSELLGMQQFVDVVIPRGGKGLIERVSAEAKMPVIKHLDGICHVYIDEEADPIKAIAIADNAKTRRYGVCNAMETLLVHENLADVILPELAKIYAQKSVELRGCAKTQGLIHCLAATEEDWSTEYLAPILSIKVVSSTEEAIDHINHYGSHHTDAIVSQNITTARDFLLRVDSSSVMINASTAFADGFEYGLGAEIGISTDKFHARGPVGLEGLTSQKYVVIGEGHIRN